MLYLSCHPIILAFAAIGALESLVIFGLVLSAIALKDQQDPH